MRNKSSQKQSDTLFSWSVGDDLAARFVEELSSTLDLDKTIKKINISRREAQEILKGLVPRITGEAGQGSLKETCAPVHKDASYTLFVDGASRGNPGKAGAGAVIKAPDGTIIKRLKSYLGIATNNVAEYRALLMALEAAQALNIQSLKIYADSELVVKQIKGKYKVRNEDLLVLYNKVQRLLKGFKKFHIDHIPREKNSDADLLANEAIDGRV